MTTRLDAGYAQDGPPAHAASDRQDDSFVDFGAWLGPLRRHKLLIALITLIGTVGAYFIIEDITPQYLASAEVLIEDQERRVMTFDTVLDEQTLNPATIGSQVEILQSRSLASRVIDELGLMDDPEFNTSLIQSEPTFLDTINPMNWLPQSLLQELGLMPDEPVGAEAQEIIEARARAAVIDRYLGRLTVEAVSFTYVLDIGFSSESPAKAANIANATAELYILNQLESKFDATAQANDWLSGRLEELRVDVIAADNALANYRAENSLGGTDRQSLIEQQLNEANGQLMEVRADRVATQARLQQMRDLVASSGPASVGAVLESGLIQGLRSREAEARRALAELSTRYGDLHPEIINKKAEIEDLGRTISEEVDKILQNLNNEVQIASAREASVRQTVNELNAQFNVEQSAEVGRLQLERQAEASRQLYDTMLARFKEVSEQQQIQQPDARVISLAATPSQPSWPKKKLMLAGAFVASLMISIGIVVIVEMMSMGFRTIEDLERILRQRGLSEVPMTSGRYRSQPEKSILNDQISGFAEAVRGISTSLILADIENPPKVIAVASTLSGEGKSSIAVSLARLMSMGKRNVLLIDGDMRKPRMHRVTGMPRSPGLSDAIASGVPLLETVRPERSTGLHILAAGSEMPNPQELLQSARAKEIFDQLRKAYDVVIIDTPAILPVSDGLLLTNIADKTVFLVRWEETPRKVAIRGLQKVLSSGADIAGVVLTRVNRKKQAGYGGKSDAYYYGRY